MQLATEAMLVEAGHFMFCVYLVIVRRLLVELSALGGSASHGCAYNAPDCQSAMQAAACASRVDTAFSVVRLRLSPGSRHSCPFQHLKD